MRKRAFTLMEIIFVIVLMAILFAFIVPNYLKLKKNVELKSCVSNMRMILGAAQFYILENPEDDKVTVSKLVKAGLLEKKPICPSLQSPDAGYYEIVDEPNKPLDVICVHLGGKGHGSLRKILGLSNNNSNNANNN